jgi:hypothetical protein
MATVPAKDCEEGDEGVERQKSSESKKQCRGEDPGRREPVGWIESPNVGRQ